MPEQLDTSLAAQQNRHTDFDGPSHEQTDYEPHAPVERAPVERTPVERAPVERAPVKWNRKELAGRMAELSSLGAGAGLTMAFELVLEAQLEGEPVCWVTMLDSSFYPPDIARSGIDLAALPVVRVKNAPAAARAADKLIRSGAFGLVVVDLVEAKDRAFVPTPLLSRLLGLASKHDTALLFLTEKQNEAASVGPLISLRARANRVRTAEGRFTCDIEILKDKRRGPGWTHCEVRHGPSGLR